MKLKDLLYIEVHTFGEISVMVMALLSRSCNFPCADDSDVIVAVMSHLMLYFPEASDGGVFTTIVLDSMTELAASKLLADMVLK